jgi:hypothetical protein
MALQIGRLRYLRQTAFHFQLDRFCQEVLGDFPTSAREDGIIRTRGARSHKRKSTACRAERGAKTSLPVQTPDRSAWRARSTLSRESPSSTSSTVRQKEVNGPSDTRTCSPTSKYVDILGSMVIAAKSLGLSAAVAGWSSISCPHRIRKRAGNRRVRSALLNHPPVPAATAARPRASGPGMRAEGASTMRPMGRAQLWFLSA